jgi:hypothetical protein
MHSYLTLLRNELEPPKKHLLSALRFLKPEFQFPFRILPRSLPSLCTSHVPCRLGFTTGKVACDRVCFPCSFMQRDRFRNCRQCYLASRTAPLAMCARQVNQQPTDHARCNPSSRTQLQNQSIFPHARREERAAGLLFSFESPPSVNSP